MQALPDCYWNSRGHGIRLHLKFVLKKPYSKDPCGQDDIGALNLVCQKIKLLDCTLTQIVALHYEIFHYSMIHPLSILHFERKNSATKKIGHEVANLRPASSSCVQSAIYLRGVSCYSGRY